MTDYKTSSNTDTNAEHADALDFDEMDDSQINYKDYRIEDWLAFVLFWILAITLFSQFLSRYVFSSPLGWTEELARYQLVALGFLGSCIGIRRNSHIFVSLFHRWLPHWVSVNLYRCIALCNLAFLVSLAYFAWQIMPLIEIHKMASLDVSVSVLYGVIFGALLIMIGRAVQHSVLIFSANYAEINSSQNTLD